MNLHVLFSGETTVPQAAKPCSDMALSLCEMVKRLVETVLKQCGGTVQGAGGAAEGTEGQASTLRNMMKRLGVAYRRRA